MNTSLFSDDLPESLSPKVAWLRKHGLRTAFDAGWTADMQESPETGDTLHPWSCYTLTPKDQTDSGEFLRTSGFGADENEAILNWCAKSGVAHYSIET